MGGRQGASPRVTELWQELWESRPTGENGRAVHKRSTTGGQMVGSHAVREMQKASLELTINSNHLVAITVAGELLDIERVTSISERGGWKRVEYQYLAGRLFYFACSS